MPLVTSPFEIDPVNFSRQGDTEINPMGPFPFGGQQYWVGTYNKNGGAGVRKLAIFSSSDLWASDTELDSTNAPTPLVGIGAAPSATINVSFDPGAGVIGVLYTLTDLTSHIIEFTCGADTYGTAGAGLAGGILNKAVSFFKRNDGTYVAIYTTGGNFIYRTCTAGVWAGPTTVAAFQYTPYAQKYDTATGITHLVFQYTTSLLYAQLDASYTLSAPIILPTTPAKAPDNFRATITFVGAGIAVGWSSYLDALGYAWAAVAPDRSAPSFTGYTLFTGNNDGSDGASYVTVTTDSLGNLWAFYVETDYNSTPFVDRIWMRAYNGSGFNAPAVFYDAVANPPADGNPDPFVQNLHTGDILQAAGKWIVATALETLNSALDHCTGFILVGVFTPAPPLAVACPVNNTATVGVPYTGQIIASGGQPPYTFEFV